MDRIEKSACTSIMVGKKASLDGSTFIARNEDRLVAIYPKKLVVRPAVSGRDKIYKSPYNGLTVKLPASGYRYTATPNVLLTDGINEEDGFNEKGVGESATESVYANSKVLSYDPYTLHGLAEDSLTTLVLPFIDSARDGVAYLGKLIAQYGAAEGNGIQFIDKDNVWYMELATGHQWVAQRIPDDCYAVAPNQISIENVNFDDPDNFMWSDGIRKFVSENDLNPDENAWNFRHIFGTNTKKDHHYNTPRVWFAQKYLNPETAEFQGPESTDMPFVRKPAHKISVEDIQYILKSHYNETPYDPLGNGSEADKKKYRAIALSRTANSHILQARPNGSPIQWLALGLPAFCAHVPFFTNVNDIDDSYKHVYLKWNMKSAFWIYETLAMVAESHYHDFIEDDIDYQKALAQWARTRIKEVDNEVKTKGYTGEELTEFLTKQDADIVDHYNQQAKDVIGKMITKGTELSKLSFKMDPNL